MNIVRRMVFACGLVMLVAAGAGCGGSEADGSPLDQTTSGARSGNSSISATSATYGGTTTITLNPGGYASQPITVGVNCYQDGVLVLGLPSWELHYAIENSLAGYSFDGVNYTVIKGPLSWMSYTGGSATCNAFASYHTKNGTARQFASTTFTVSP